jgi:hypothetical protein
LVGTTIVQQLGNVVEGAGLELGSHRGCPLGIDVADPDELGFGQLLQDPGVMEAEASNA